MSTPPEPVDSHRVALPEAFVESVRRFRAEGLEPAEPRDAATVLLLRPGADGAPELFLMRRQTSMAFAGGMYVFPGGGVDRRDSDAEVRWAGPSPARWAERLGTDEARARALVCAAVRETFEESGVLLAGSEEGVVSDTSGDDWQRDRAALEDRELAFSDFLQQRGLVLRTDLLAAFRGWLTPEFEPRRYRTWFFAAALPQGQRTGDPSRESDRVAWVPARRAVEQAEAGEAAMLPPTYQSCLEVAQHPTPEAVLAAAADRTVEMFTPDLVDDDDGEPWMTSPAWMQQLLSERAEVPR
ncbi:NUDIX hydrolase [Nocardioides marmoraquaticus]